jgi:uncharacterized protein YgbK (DUF1537 family)
MPPRHLHVLADDLSGAAECAAALALVAGQPAPLVLSGTLPDGGNCAVDLDSRALAAPAAADIAARALQEAAARGAALLFKKVDSTLRGNLAAELCAILSLPDPVDAVVVCPSLPSQGRTVAGGVLHVQGQPQVDGEGRPLDLLRLLTGAHPRRRLLTPGPDQSAAGLAGELLAAVRSGARVLVVDAARPGELRRLAQALVAARGACRLLAVGSAGLARALADELLLPAGTDRPAPPGPGAGPLVAVVGSFNGVTRHQVSELAAEPDVHLVRLDTAAWLERGGPADAAIAAAAEQAQRGKSVVLAATGAMPLQSSRQLVQRMALAAEPLIRQATVLVLTGGDTARAVLDRLGITRLEVFGELEPGICLSRVGADARAIVTKAGGFGDPRSLVRVLRHFHPGPAIAGESKE